MNRLSTNDRARVLACLQSSPLPKPQALQKPVGQNATPTAPRLAKVTGSVRVEEGATLTAPSLVRVTRHVTVKGGQ